MKRIALIHFQPPELYPPVMNFIDCKTDATANIPLDIYTTTCQARLAPFVPRTANNRLFRFGAKNPPRSAIARAWHYLGFNVRTIARLIRTKPATVIYFETISAFPAFIYKKWINPRSRLFIHYHEYMTPHEYEHGMRLVKWFHRLERGLYRQASWVSHTNKGRMERFVGDLGNMPIPNKQILPNYPPKSWLSAQRSTPRPPIKVVYIGSLSLDTMYTREFARWVLDQQGKVCWDIYSYNLSEEAETFLRGLPAQLVRLHPGVSYPEIPRVLKHYDLGVILYTGHIPNWVDNAPNKLFEYLSCGLDVWVPGNMTGSLPYITHGTYPKVSAVDFTDLGSMDPDTAMDRSGLTWSQPSYFCEDVYRPLWNLMANQ